MAKPLRVLLVEDSPDDAALVLHELKRGGFEVEYKRVDSPTAYLAALEENPWDVILSDFAMPQFNGLLAFDMTLERGLDIPFIFVSGRIGEDRAAEAMRRGAKDYVLKDHLKRLVPAVERELRDAEERRRRRATAHALRESEEKYRTLLESSIQGVGVIRNLKVLFANAAFVELFGFGSLEELVGESSIADFIASEDRLKLEKVYRDRLAGREIPARTELRARRKDGAPLVVDASLKVVPWEGQDAVLAVLVDVTERKRVEENLRASEHLLQTVFDTIPHSVRVTDPAGNYLMVNKAWCRFYNTTPDEALQKNCWEFPGRPEAEKAHAYQEDQQVLSGKGAFRVADVIYTSHRGERLYVRSHKAPLRDEKGDVAGMIGIYTNMTAERQAQEELRASQRLLRTVFDAIPHHIVVKDRNSRFLMVNKAWCNTHGLAETEVVHRTLPGSPPQSREEPAQAFREGDEAVMAGAGSIRIVERAETEADGKVHTFQDIRVPFRDDSGEVIGLVGIAVDLTEQRDAQRRADLAHARLYDAVESLPAAFFLFDEQERIVLWNSRVREFYAGLYEELEPGMKLERALAYVAQSFQEAQSDPEAWRREQLNLYRRNPLDREHQMTDGRWVQSLTRYTSDGGMVFLCFDISEMKRREQELRQAQKMEAVGQLTGGVAHDFNNLLQVISGYVELAMSEVGEDSRIFASLRTADETCQRAADLTQRLLAFSRKQMLRPQLLDIYETVKAITKLLEHLLPENVVVDVKEGASVDPVIADRGMIEQVLMNLAVNARDAMPDGGTITVEVLASEFDSVFCRSNLWARPGRYTALRFSDTGVGMTQEVKDRIFDPFFTTKELGKGTGLGLSTVYGIVQQHEGLIHVETQPGAGATFWIYLPVRDRNRSEVDEAAQRPLQGGAETILVAEDEQQVRDLLVHTLRSAGYRVLEATDGQDAIEIVAAAATPIDLAVLDMTMPKLGGRDAHFRMQTAQPGLRALFASGWFSPDEQRTLVSEDLPFIYKPYSREQILRAVRQVLDRVPK